MIHLIPEDTSPRPADTYFFDIWLILPGPPIEQGPVVEVAEFIVKEPVTVVS